MQLACEASVSVGSASKERPRNGISFSLLLDPTETLDTRAKVGTTRGILYFALNGSPSLRAYSQANLPPRSEMVKGGGGGGGKAGSPKEPISLEY